MSDVFISYARDDDNAPPGAPELKGFVTFLDENLRYAFKDLGPVRPDVWRDTRRVPDAAQIDREIETAIREARFLLVILSPNWMARPWCRGELDAFVRQRRADGLKDDDIRSLVFVVSKRWVDIDQRPFHLQNQATYEFYKRSDTQGEIDGDHDYFSRGEVVDDRYWKKLNELARYMLQRLEVVPPAPAVEPSACAVPASGRTFFLAKPASDMRQAYDRLVKELTAHGHRVVPDVEEDLPLDDTTPAVIDDALAEAEIAIHLLGRKDGPTPESGDTAIVPLQLRRAAARASRPGAGFHRVVWAPKTLDGATTAAPPVGPADAAERVPLDVLRRLDALLPTDKVEGDSLSKFVDFVGQHIVAITPARPVAAFSQNGGGDIRLYLYHSPEDTDYVLELATALQSRQVEPVLPVFDGPEADIRKFHSEMLSDCDAVALCWASASEVWVRAQAMELRDWHQFGRKNQFAYRAVVAAPPPGGRKKALKLLFPRSEIDMVLDLSDKNVLAPDLLDPLVPAQRASAA